MERITGVPRSKQDARRAYNRISPYYDLMAGFFERGPAARALTWLEIKPGQQVLEIGFGTGHTLLDIARSVGPGGAGFGVDISEGMLKITRGRLERAGLLSWVKLYRGDALDLPFEDAMFDSVFMAFTLELFDTPEINGVLCEAHRVTRPGGKLAVISLLRQPDSVFVKLYERLHCRWPNYIDCRPIYPAESIEEAGYEVLRNRKSRLVVLPVETVLARKS